MKKFIGITLLSVSLTMAACSNQEQAPVEEVKAEVSQMSEQEMTKVAQELLTDRSQALWSNKETVQFEDLQKELYLDEATIEPKLSTYENYNDLNTYELSQTFENEKAEVKDQTISYQGTLKETLKNDKKTVELINDVELTIQYDEASKSYKIKNQKMTQKEAKPTYVKQQKIEWSPEQKANLSEDIITQVTNILNEVGDVPKDTITFNGLQSLDTGGENILKLDVFVRNGFEYPVSNINGEVEVIVHEQKGEEVIEVPIAKANFNLAEMGTIPSGSTIIWTLIFGEDFLLVDDIKKYDLNQPGQKYTLKTTMKYKY